MPATFNHGGTHKPPKDMYARIGGAWTAVEKFFLKHASIWQLHYQNEIVVTLSNRSSYLFLKSLFTTADWASTKRKRVVIPAGVELGTAHSYAIAISSTADGQATSWGGELIIDNFGIVSGIGGAANSGNGGDAILANLLGRSGQKLIINNYGTLRAGGGGGGRAGNGGAGQYPYTASEQGAYDRNRTRVHVYGGLQRNMWWNGVVIRDGAVANGSSFVSGIYTYRQGVTAEQIGQNYYCFIHRDWTAYQPTSGGIAGNAGRGQGFDGAATAGANPVAGGTNAGASGKSGNGGAWGEPGQAGANGAAGNVGAGASGAAAGLAGAYLNGNARAILNNFGTLRGRLI